jgi:hypothetical protein
MSRNFLDNDPAGPITGLDSFPGIQSGGDVLFSFAALFALAWDRNSHIGFQAMSTITGLTAALAALAADADVVHDTGNETIAGTKTFSSAPVVPDASWTIAKTSGLQAALDALPIDSSVVHDTGDETIAGVKTFSSSPIVPTPTTAFQAAPKGYVESLITAGAGVRVEEEGSTVVAAATGLNFVGGSVTVTDAGSGEATVTFGQSTALGVFYVGAATGVAITDIANVEAAIDAATAAPRGGIVQFGPGVYNLAGIDPILLPENGATGKQIIIRGAGAGNGTLLLVSTDGAVDEYLFAGSGLSSFANGSYKTVLEDLTVFGPQAFTAYETDETVRVPCNLSGVMLDTHVTINRCTFLGFRFGFNSAGNHNVITNSKFSNCYVGARWSAVGGLGGDVLLDNVDLAGNTFASHYINNDAVASWHSVRGHVGFAPWEYYIEDGGTVGQTRMYYCVFDATSHEFAGNGMIYSGDQSAMVDECHWRNCGNFSTNNAVYGLPSSDYENHVFLHTFARSSFTNGSPTYACTESHYNVSTALTGVTIHRCLAAMAQAVTDGVPYIKGPAGANQASVVLLDANFRAVAVPVDSVGAVVAKTLVEWTQFGHVRPHAYHGTGIRTQIAGVARNAVTAGNREFVLVVQESPDQEILMTGGVDPTATQVLVPSSDATNRSYVMPFSWDGTNATRQIVGQLYLAVGGSGSVRARVRIP